MQEEWENIDLQALDLKALSTLRAEVQSAYDQAFDREFQDEDSPEYYRWLDALDQLEEFLEDIKAALENF